MGRLQETLLEFGRGSSYVGRQVHFDVEGDDFYVGRQVHFDVEQLRYVVIELKTWKFKPVVDDRLRRPGPHSPTVGILLCANHNDAVVHYALANTTAPMGVTGYTSSPIDPDQVNLPRRAELEAILTIPVTGRSDAALTGEDA